MEAVTDGRILGHEAVGTVTEVGAAVTGLAPGDRVLVPAISSDLPRRLAAHRPIGSTTSIPTLLTMVASGRIPAEKMGTHTFGLDEIERAYEVFGNAAAHEALKVMITTR